MEVLLSLALLGLAVAGCAQVLLHALSAQSQAALHERAAWHLADGGELVQAWPAGAPAAQTADWQAMAAAIVADDPARPVAATLQPAPEDASPARSWQARLGWAAGDGGSTSAVFAGYAHARAPP
jgi:Tfp pilus assembly protein PilV